MRACSRSRSACSRRWSRDRPAPYPASARRHRSDRGSTSTSPTSISSSSRSGSPSTTRSATGRRTCATACSVPIRVTQIPDNRVGVDAAVGSAHRRRHLQQPDQGRRRRPGPDEVRRGRPVFPRLVPAQFKSAPNYTPVTTGAAVVDPAASTDQQPDRRPDGDQPGRRRRGRSGPRRSRHPARSSSQRGPRRRPVRAVQLVVHAVRPVLRPRPRPGQQGRPTDMRARLRARWTPTTRCSCQGSPTNFMVLTRAIARRRPEATNQTTPFVDQSQTYTSHPSHQVFLREYDARTAGTSRSRPAG